MAVDPSLVVAIVGAATGAGSIIFAARSNTVAERAVGVEEFKAYTAAMELTLARRDRQVGELREEIANCEADKERLNTRVDRLADDLASLKAAGQ